MFQKNYRSIALAILSMFLFSCEDLNKLITPDSKSTDTNNSSNDNNDDDNNDNDSPEESDDGVGTWLFNNPDWNNSNLYEFRFNQLTGNGTDNISNIVDYNGEPCWVGFSAGMFQGSVVWCRIDGIDTEISNTSGGYDDAPGNLVVGGTNLYFTAFNGSTGTKMYKFDGTSVTQISDTNPNGDDRIAYPVATTTNLYFRATDGDTSLYQFGEYKVYQYDGVSTTVLPDTDSDGNDEPHNLTLISNDLYYTAYNEAHLAKIFKWDGTTNLEIDPTKYGGVSYNYNPFYMGTIGSDHYFRLYKASVGNRTYQLTGTTLTEVSAINIPPAPPHLQGMFASINSGFVFSAGVNNNKLYHWDGTTLTQVSNTYTSGSDSPAGMILINDKIYFSSAIGGSGTHKKLFEYDGTTVTQISNTSESSSISDDPSEITDYNGDVYFSAKDSGGLRKIYKYDGSSVSQVSNLYSNGDDYPLGLKTIGDDLYFSAQNEDGYRRLYKLSESTITQESNTDNFGGYTVAGPAIHDNALYFGALQNDGNGLFKWDGSEITQFPGSPTTTLGQLNSFVSIGQNLYFVGISDLTNSYTKVYRFDGSSTTQISDTNTTEGWSDDMIMEIKAVGNDLYFSAFDGIGGWKVFRFDGSSVIQVSDINSGADDFPTHLIDFNGVLHFAAYNDMGQFHMYKYENGTVTQAFDTFPDDDDYITMADSINPPLVINSKMYFSARNEFGLLKVFQWDGSTLTQISDVNVSGDDYPYSITALGADLYFSAYDGSNTKLYMWDGSAVIQISDTSEGNTDNPYLMTAYENKLYFKAIDSTNSNTKLFCWDGSTVTQISDTRPGGDDNIAYTFVAGSKLFFYSHNENGKSKLYQWNGTEVSLVADLNPNGEDYPLGYTLFQNDLYFSATPRGFARLMKIDF